MHTQLHKKCRHACLPTLDLLLESSLVICGVWRLVCEVTQPHRGVYHFFHVLGSVLQGRRKRPKSKPQIRFWGVILVRTTYLPQCTSIKGLLVSIRWYLGFLKGQLAGAGNGTLSCTAGTEVDDGGLRQAQSWGLGMPGSRRSARCPTKLALASPAPPLPPTQLPLSAALASIYHEITAVPVLQTIVLLTFLETPIGAEDGAG